MKKLLLIALLAGFLVVFGSYGYLHWFAKADGYEISIKKDDAEKLDVDIDFGVGDLLIHGGSPGWLSGELIYDHKKMEPKVKYKQRKGVGVIDIEQGSKTMLGFSKKKLKNEWDIQLADDIPIDLDVSMGVSNSTLELEGIQLSSLAIESGVSDSVVDLSGVWNKSFKADLDVGVGDLTLILPKQTGVRLNVSKGIGSLEAKGFTTEDNKIYVNNSFANADIIIDIKLDIGVGSVKVKLAE